MIKPTLWEGDDLPGEWVVTYKIDGVRGLSNGVSVVSRAGKPLYHVQHLASLFKDAEIFCGNFKKTVSLVKASKGGDRDVILSEIFSLDPLDERLFGGIIREPTSSQILQLLKLAIENGYEGVVLRQGDDWRKVIPRQTYDVEVIGIQEGKGKNMGKLGAFLTRKGKVGTGFTDKERERFFDKKYIGSLIEVGCKELTKKGQFRHPRFIRERWDK